MVNNDFQLYNGMFKRPPVGFKPANFSLSAATSVFRPTLRSAKFAISDRENPALGRPNRAEINEFSSWDVGAPDGIEEPAPKRRIVRSGRTLLDKLWMVSGMASFSALAIRDCDA